MNNLNEKPLYKEVSDEFKLYPGTVVLNEKETGHIISDFIKKKSSCNNFNLVMNLNNDRRLWVCVRQKYGPDLGFQFIDL